VDEQVEEEESVTNVLDAMKRIGDTSHGLIQLDLWLAKRGE
jgi:ferritin